MVRVKEKNVLCACQCGQGMARDVAAGLDNIVALIVEVLHMYSLKKRFARKKVVVYGTAPVP